MSTPATTSEAEYVGYGTYKEDYQLSIISQEPVKISSPNLDLQSASDNELAIEADYDRKLKALSALYGNQRTGARGLFVEAAEALNTVYDKSISNDSQAMAEKWKKFVEMCAAVKNLKNIEDAYHARVIPSDVRSLVPEASKMGLEV